MRDQPRDDRARAPADAGQRERSGDRRRARPGERVAGPAPRPTRLNRYVAAAGLGTRREVEGLIRAGRVRVNGEVADDPAAKVAHGDAVLLDGEELRAAPQAAVLLHKPAGAGAEIVHPPTMHVVMPLRRIERGAELLLADEALARRIANPSHPQPQLRDGRMRVAYAGLAVDDLEPGEWRPLGHKELERLRRSVRLPPRG